MPGAQLITIDDTSMDCHRASIRSELHSISEQVDQYLLYFLLISADPFRKVIANIHVQR